MDDGSNGSFGKEIEFRAKLENELRKGKSAVHYEHLSIKRRKNLEVHETIPENETDDDENETFELKPGF